MMSTSSTKSGEVGCPEIKDDVLRDVKPNVDLLEGVVMRTHVEENETSVVPVVLQTADEEPVVCLKEQLARVSLSNQQLQMELLRETQAKNRWKKAKHRIVPSVFSIESEGTRAKSFLGRMSLQSRDVIKSIPKDLPDRISVRVSQAFDNPIEAIQYLHSPQFGVDVIELSKRCGEILMDEQRCLQLQGPAYVFGDIHGNLNDLKFFARNVWNLGIQLTPGKFIFLGDYVDRGLSSLECVAYLFAQKVLYPDKVFLLRGNHEVRNVNGWEEHYGSACFLAQCKKRFGADEGSVVWNEVNNAFDRMPLAAVIDDDIFCTHGGIPRPLNSEKQIETLEKVPRVLRFDRYMVVDEFVQVAKDCMWGDPATTEQEATLDHQGFGPSTRGGDAICFGDAAIDRFLQQHNFSYIIRAHEACYEGVGVSKSGRVFTVFSTSKNHGLGESAQCGCLLIDHNQVFVITRSMDYGKSSGRSRRFNAERFRMTSMDALSTDEDDDDNQDDYSEENDNNQEEH